MSRHVDSAAAASALRPPPPLATSDSLQASRHLLLPLESGDTFVTSQMIILVFLDRANCFCLDPGVRTPIVEQVVSKVSTFHENLEPGFLGSQRESMNECEMYVRTLFAVFIFVGADYLLGLLE